MSYTTVLNVLTTIEKRSTPFPCACDSTVITMYEEPCCAQVIFCVQTGIKKELACSQYNIKRDLQTQTSLLTANCTDIVYFVFGVATYLLLPIHIHKACSYEL